MRACPAPRRSLARFASLAVVAPLAAVLAASCAGIVGVEGNYKSAVASMCTCDNIASAYGGDKKSCVDHFEDRLAAADKEEIDAWLATYVDLSCDLCSSTYALTKLACVHSAPFCSPDGQACEAALDCCGYPGSTACLGATAGAGVCGACKAEGDDCATDEECCGYHGPDGFLGFDPPYCHGGVCTREPADCARSFNTCSTTSDCCGLENAICQKNTANPAFKYCIESCDGANPHNCPGCCAVTYSSMTSTDVLGICADGQPEECGRYCTDEGQPCAQGGTCVRSCSPVPGVLVSLSRCYLTCI